MRDSMLKFVALSSLGARLIAHHGGTEDETHEPAACTASESGVLMIHTTLDPTTPTVGQHALSMHVMKDGAGIDGATLSVDPQMPHHGHGSLETATIAAMGGGMYRATLLTLQMAGMWRVSITADSGADHGENVLCPDVK
jgi:hypothetical protein